MTTTPTQPTYTNIRHRKKRAVTKPDGHAMLGSVAKYLEKKGWKVLVIGSPRIEQQPGDLQFNYEFILRFTGKKKDADS